MFLMQTYRGYLAPFMELCKNLSLHSIRRRNQIPQITCLYLKPVLNNGDGIFVFFNLKQCHPYNLHVAVVIFI